MSSRRRKGYSTQKEGLQKHWVLRDFGRIPCPEEANNLAKVATRVQNLAFSLEKKRLQYPKETNIQDPNCGVKIPAGASNSRYSAQSS